MTNQQVHLKEAKAEGKSMGLGYRISQTGEAAKIAFGLATDLVKEAFETGTHLRTWCIETKEKTHQLLKLSNHLISQEPDKKITAEEIQEAILDVVRWENEISGSIRNYFMKISNQLNRLKSLNPPLKSEELDPYVEAILSERRATMAALEPLGEVIEKIAQLKTEVWFEARSTSQRSL